MSMTTADTRPGTGVALRLDTNVAALRALAQIARARLGETCRADAEWVLRFADDRVELLGPGDAPGSGVAAATRRPVRTRGQQPLKRALGSGKRRVLDATGGVGDDALLIHSMGHQVTVVERSPIAHALLAGAAIIGQLPFRVLFGDARELVTRVDPAPEVVYLDPMFPPKRRQSALARKAPRYLQQMVGSDTDSRELLAVARRVALDRVVVKRPDHAPPLAEDIRQRFSGKLVHYDVYDPQTPGATAP